jgi:hypothetical protein
MVDRNTVIVDRSPQAADPMLENITNPRSPQTQKCDIQEINEDNCQTHIIYHFQNCGTVNMDSFNARNVRMENCGNNVPQLTCSLFFLFFVPSQLTWPYHIVQITVLGLSALKKFYTHNLMQSPMVCGHLRHLPLNMLNAYFLL